jgi:hypothetical protein
MEKKPVVLYKTLVIGIIFLFIGMSVFSSIGDNVEDISSNTHFLNAVDNSDILKFRGKTAYAYIAYGGGSGHSEGLCYFYLDDPGTLYPLYPIEYIGINGSSLYMCGSTWTTDGRWLFCDLNGVLFEIDPETGDVTAIGGGGTGCHGLAWDPVYNRLFATDGSNLIEYDPDTGEQTVIGSHGIVDTLIALAINFDGVCYAWDVKFSGNAILYTIDLETGEATEVGDMGINLIYAQDGAFDWDADILYLAAYSTTGFLATCNVETGELTEIGNFEGGAELSILVIPYGIIPRFTWTPALPKPNETILFNASKSFAHHNNIDLYEWDWDKDGIFDENHTNPTAAHSWSSAGHYPVTLQITDNSNTIRSITKTVRVGNYPPDTPEIEGLRRFNEGEGGEYPYVINSTDPEGDDIYYLINWSDGTQDETGYYESGEEITINVTIPSEKGTYDIFKIKAIDIFGSESNWAILEVTVPRNRATINSLLQLFLERFSLLERLLSLIRIG